MNFNIHQGDVLRHLATFGDASVNCCVTSPPYWGLRDYGVDGQIGLESTPEAFVARLAAVFAEVRRVLTPDGTCWVNLGDSYNNREGQRKQGVERNDVAGWKQATNTGSTNVGSRHVASLKPKDLCGIPWRVAFALQSDGWYLRQDIIWHKPNPMPESVRDRCTKAHEYVFMLTKSARYFYDAEAIKEPGIYAGPNGQQKSPHAQGFGRRTKEQEATRQDKQRGHGRRHAGFNDRWDLMSVAEQCGVMRNKRDVWTLATLPAPDAHFATFPIELPELCIRAGCPEGGLVLDPFSGAATTGLACLKNNRRYVGIELNAEYVEISWKRARRHFPLLLQGEVA